MKNQYHVQLQDGSFIKGKFGNLQTTQREMGAFKYSYQHARNIAAMFKTQGAKLVRLTYDGSPYVILCK